ncbi:hypothetical protein GW17_00023494 [Ensete ventricosum]|nr:hypothetical protein GW17_00023494 [Ensete ventricosum]
MSYRPMSSGMDMSLHLELYLTDPSLRISSILIPLLCFDLLSDSLRFFWVFGQYNFEGRYDLVRFIKTVQKVGLYVHLRIGPYVCAEWNFGYVSNFSNIFIFRHFLYHVPRSWLQPTRNLLVVFEELGGDATKILLAKRSISSVCADVSEWHPTIKNWHIENYGRPEEHRKPKVHLRCAPGQFISAIKFASYGTPIGTCGNFQQGVCHSPNSAAILEKVTKLISFILLRFDKHIYFLFINIAHYEIRFLEVPRTTNLG